MLHILNLWLSKAFDFALGLMTVKSNIDILLIKNCLLIFLSIKHVAKYEEKDPPVKNVTYNLMRSFYFCKKFIDKDKSENDAYSLFEIFEWEFVTKKMFSPRYLKDVSMRWKVCRKDEIEDQFLGFLYFESIWSFWTRLLTKCWKPIFKFRKLVEPLNNCLLNQRIKKLLTNKIWFDRQLEQYSLLYFFINLCNFLLDSNLRKNDKHISDHVSIITL